jgi:hypothetical protein
MPFDPDFNDIYKIGIKETCEDAGAFCERVDEQTFPERILDRIYNQISKADIVIADMTGKNPNVFYEVGYAHALGKLTLLLVQKEKDIPFNLRHHPFIIYGESISKLRDELSKKVKHYVDHPPEREFEKRLVIDLYIDRRPLSADKIGFIRWPKNETGFFPIGVTIHNSSAEVITNDSFHLNLVVSDTFQWAIERDEYTRHPKGGFLKRFPQKGPLFPDEYQDTHIILSAVDHEKEFALGLHEFARISLSTTSGTWEYPVQIQTYA